MNAAELAEVLRLHALGKPEGVQADLSYEDLTDASLAGVNLQEANLRKVNLQGANLQDANLRGAILVSANLGSANLRDVDLEGADLRGANLRGADLGDAYLDGANLTDADLGGANLWGADLRDAKLEGATLWNVDLEGALLPELQLPQGDWVVWKKALASTTLTPCVVKLLIPAAARRTASLVGGKCRAEYAQVLEIDGTELAVSVINSTFQYPLGEAVYPDSYDDDIRVECAHGIHFFQTRHEAEAF